jgi:hypothetical protein
MAPPVPNTVLPHNWTVVIRDPLLWKECSLVRSSRGYSSAGGKPETLKPKFNGSRRSFVCARDVVNRHAAPMLVDDVLLLLPCPGGEQCALR